MMLEPGLPRKTNGRTGSAALVALGFGISGSGPSVYALTKGIETAQKVCKAIDEIISPIGIDFEIHLSKINDQGIKILPN